MSTLVVLVDLDDTLLPDTVARDAALISALAEAKSERTLAEALTIVREKWRHSHVRTIPSMAGVSSWEALWTDFNACELPAPAVSDGHQFQDEVWCQLAPDGPETAAAAFVDAREAAVAPYPWVFQRLEKLGVHHRLWCVTNGSSYLQRRKLRLSRLENSFAQVLVSGEIGDVKASTAFVEQVRRRLRMQQTSADRVIGDSQKSDGYLASALGIPLVLVVPGSDFA